jgi:hypothetical protein
MGAGNPGPLATFTCDSQKDGAAGLELDANTDPAETAREAIKLTVRNFDEVKIIQNKLLWVKLCIKRVTQKTQSKYNKSNQLGQFPTIRNIYSRYFCLPPREHSQPRVSSRDKIGLFRRPAQADFLAAVALKRYLGAWAA